MNTWKTTVGELLAHIQFTQNPFDKIDTAVHAVGQEATKLRETIMHLDIALNRSEPLSFLVQQPHSEELVRDYLHDVLRALKEVKPITAPANTVSVSFEPPKEKLLIAVDFDGTIVEHRFPEIGAPLPDAFDVLRSLQARGHRLVLFTCREDQMDETGRLYLTEALDFCKRQGVTFVSANQNLSADDFRPQGGRKVHADIYIDDRNLGGFPGWERIGEMLLGTKKDASPSPSGQEGRAL
jgi:hypothetical protein